MFTNYIDFEDYTEGMNDELCALTYEMVAEELAREEESEGL